VLKAADAAARWHVHQRRKGAAQEPYINHLLEVATLVAEVTGGNDPDLVIAALTRSSIHLSSLCGRCRPTLPDRSVEPKQISALGQRQSEFPSHIAPFLAPNEGNRKRPSNSAGALAAIMYFRNKRPMLIALLGEIRCQSVPASAVLWC
jgi:hypothetical protein